MAFTQANIERLRSAAGHLAGARDERRLGQEAMSRGQAGFREGLAMLQRPFERQKEMDWEAAQKDIERKFLISPEYREAQVQLEHERRAMTPEELERWQQEMQLQKDDMNLRERIAKLGANKGEDKGDMYDFYDEVILRMIHDSVDPDAAQFYTDPINKQGKIGQDEESVNNIVNLLMEWIPESRYAGLDDVENKIRRIVTTYWGDPGEIESVIDTLKQEEKEDRKKKVYQSFNWGIPGQHYFQFNPEQKDNELLMRMLSRLDEMRAQPAQLNQEKYKELSDRFSEKVYEGNLTYDDPIIKELYDFLIIQQGGFFGLGARPSGSEVYEEMIRQIEEESLAETWETRRQKFE